MRKFLHTMWQDKAIRTAIWMFFSGLIAYGMGYISLLINDNEVLKALITGLLFPLINAIMKHINVTYLGDVGVDQE